jgi:hypothetical protein
MRSIFIFIAIVAFFPVFGQDVKVTLTINPTEVQENEAFLITVETNTNGNLDLHLSSDFEVLSSNRSVTSSSSVMVIINGRVQRKSADRTVQYSYTCRIAKAGRYTVSDATFQTSNELINLDKANIHVTKAPPVGNSLKSNLNKNFFGIIQASRTKVYVGEPVKIYSKVYSRARITDVTDYTPTKITGTVHKTDLLKNRQNLQARNEQIQGINFQTVEISNDVLIPQESGKITCEPFQIKIGYQGNFIFSDYATITSGKEVIRVMPLPKNAPVSFQGAVGKYSVKTSISKTKLKEGDAFTYKITLSGKGNIHLLSTPELTLPDAFELYGDPKITDKHIVTSEGGEGTIEYEYIIQANEEGEFTLEPYSFSYFNPSSEKYVEIPISSYKLKVAKGDHSESNESNGTRNDIEFKNEGIKYIVAKSSGSQTNFLWTQFIFWCLVLLPFLVAIPLGLIVKNRTAQKDTILANQQYKKAGKIASKRLEKASELLQSGDEKAFNEEIYTVFTSFLAQKMKCATSEITREKIKLKFAEEETDQTTIDGLMNGWNDLEMVKFGLSTSVSSEELLQEISSLIEQIDLQWK